MKYYKLLTQEMTSHNNTKWKLNEKITVDKPGNKMCSDEVLHCYNHPLLAVIFNPIHGNIPQPRLFEISVDSIVATDDLKFASKSQTLIEKLPLPEISLDQKIEFAIRVAKLVYKDSAWNLWADNWLNGSDRSKEIAYTARAAVWAAATAAARAAVYATAAARAAAAYAAAYAAYAAYAADAADAADAARAAADAAYNAAYAASVFSDKNKFNQKMIDIIEEIVKVKY